MTERRALPVKLYYRIGEVSELVGVEPHVLRYWESEFRSIRPQKSPKGQRVYSRRDLEKLLRVKELLYTEGYTIAGAKRQLKEGVPADKQASREVTDGEEATDGGATSGDASTAQLGQMREALAGLRDEIRRELARLDEDDADGPTMS
jgi:DNA-binding transcriptional MerR regulator